MTSIDQKKLFSGERRSLAKAITLIESTREEDREEAAILLEAAIKKSGKSLRIGISGVPGVGKSTFIEAFGQKLIDSGKKVAVLAVDPSSPLSGGSIMGDKTRMESLSQNQEAFIRPSPSSGALGGVAHKTRESMLLCEAAGYDIILIETVGVGQSEYEVASMVDFFLVLMLPGGGDEIQGIKKGILELADAIVINKADGEATRIAEQTKGYYESALQLLSHKSFWQPQVMSCSSLEETNITEVSKMIEDYHLQSLKNKHFAEKRSKQNKEWMERIIHYLIEQRLKNNAEVQSVWNSLEEEVMAGKKTPFAAAAEVVSKL